MPSARRAFWALVLLCFCISLSTANEHVHRRRDDVATTPSPTIPSATIPSAAIPSTSLPSTFTDGQTSSGTQNDRATTGSVSTQPTSNSSGSTSSATSAAASAPSTSRTVLPSAAANATAVDGLLPLQPQITPGLGIGGVLLILSGAAYALIGIKNRRVQIGLSAGYLGSLSVTVLIIYVMVLPVSWAIQGAYVVAITMTGLIVGGISVIFPDLTEGFGCLFGGFSLAMWLLVLKPGGLLTSSIPIVIFIVAFTVATYATSFSHYTRPFGLMASTSFGGGTAVVIGVDCFSQAGLKEFWAYIWNLNPNMFPPGTTTYPLTRGMKVEIASIIVIFLIGLAVQSRIWKLMKERREKRAALAKTYGRAITREEERSGRRVEFINTRERAKWEAIYGDKPKVLDSADSGEAAAESPVKESFKSAASANYSDSIELSELPDTPMSRQGFMGKARDATIMVTVVEDDEPEPELELDGRPEHASQPENTPEATIQAEDPAEKLVEKKGSLGPKSAKPSDQEIRERIEGTVARLEPPPRVVPLPFKVPNVEDDDDRSSVATVDDDEIGTPPLNEVFQGSNKIRTAFRESQSDFEGLSRPDSAASLKRASFNDLGDRSSVIATVDDTTDAASERSLPDVSPPHSPTTSQFLGEELLHPVEEKIVMIDVPQTSPELKGKDRMDAEPEPSPTRSNKSASTTSSPIKDREAKATIVPAPGSARGTSTSSKSVRFSLAEGNLPSSVSKVVMSYRTNEWAKHLSNADMPEFEELNLSKSTAALSPAAATDKIATVNVDELTQTPETGAVAPAPARTILKSNRQSTIPPPSPSPIPPSYPQISRRTSNRLNRMSSAPMVGPTLVESPHEESSPPLLWRTNSHMTANSPPGPILTRRTTGFSDTSSRLGATTPDLRLADDNISLSARRSILLHSNSFPAQPKPLPHRASPTPDRQSAALRASMWRASMQAELAGRNDPTKVIEERRSMLIREKAEMEEGRKREAEEGRRIEWEREEMRRREGGERHREAMRKLQGVANKGL